MSLALFALGGVMGFLIDGSDTRTPAHYHAVITAVSVSSAGMLLTYGLKELGKPPAPPRATRILIGLYGGGQFVASIAMFVAGGYGALAQNPVRRRNARHRRRRGHGNARDRFDLHDPRRGDLRHRRHPRVVADLAGSLDAGSLTSRSFERRRAP